MRGATLAAYRHFSSSACQLRTTVIGTDGVGGRAHDEARAVGRHGKRAALVRALAVLDARVDGDSRLTDRKRGLPGC